MTPQADLRQQIFDLVTDPPCRGCEFWDRQGHYCFLKHMHNLTDKCSLLSDNLSLFNQWLEENKAMKVAGKHSSIWYFAEVEPLRLDLPRVESKEEKKCID